MSKRSFREIWLKPEVYPLIGSMVVALGVCGAQLANKISQPGMTFSKSARKGGIHAQFEMYDDNNVQPALGGYFKNKSYSIFDHESEINDSKLIAPAIPEIIADDEEAADEVAAAVEAAVEEAKEAVEDAAKEAEEADEEAKDSVEEEVVEAVPDEAEEKLLEKGAELAAELKKIVPEPPAAAAA